MDENLRLDVVRSLNTLAAAVVHIADSLALHNAMLIAAVRSMPENHEHLLRELYEHGRELQDAVCKICKDLDDCVPYTGEER